MSHQEIDPKKFVLTAFLSFAAVFCFLMLMRLWQGDYQIKSSGEMHYHTKTIEP